MQFSATIVAIVAIVASVAFAAPAPSPPAAGSANPVGAAPLDIPPQVRIQRATMSRARGTTCNS